MKVLIVGGTGVISRSIVSELLEKGHQVTMINRGRRELSISGDVERLTADRADRPGFAAAVDGRHFDAVIDMICFTPADAENTVSVFRDKTDHLVICSSVAAYRRPYHSIPTREDEEKLWDDPSFAYAYNKAQMEHTLAGMGGAPPITIFRPSLTYGDGARNVGVLRQNYGIVDRLRRGKPLVMFGDGTNPWSFTFTPDLARGVVGLLGNKSTFGQAYHITNEEPTLWRDLYLEMGAILGKEAKIVTIPSATLYHALPELCQHLVLEKSHPGLFDNGKIRSIVPAYKARISLRQGLEALIESWERDGLQADPEKDRLEDSLVTAAAMFGDRLAAAVHPEGE